MLVSTWFGRYCTVFTPLEVHPFSIWPLFVNEGNSALSPHGYTCLIPTLLSPDSTTASTFPVRRLPAASPEKRIAPTLRSSKPSPTPAYHYSINPCFEANVAGSESNAVTSENGIPFSLLGPFSGNSPVAFLITAFPAEAKICTIRGI